MSSALVVPPHSSVVFHAPDCASVQRLTPSHSLRSRTHLAMHSAHDTRVSTPSVCSASRGAYTTSLETSYSQSRSQGTAGLPVLLLFLLLLSVFSMTGNICARCSASMSSSAAPCMTSSWPYWGYNMSTGHAGAPCVRRDISTLTVPPCPRHRRGRDAIAVQMVATAQPPTPAHAPPVGRVTTAAHPCVRW